ncbi:uncharacterized protein [Onthophagus taurus]|uniref:uncharacterized protein n=1 Tax=Onthophagus taurus TaxID=166361 RepID=UPI000C2075A3|nr:uncharacterized protein LOC111427830 [Onthophagus taurus]
MIMMRSNAGNKMAKPPPPVPPRPSKHTVAEALKNKKVNVAIQQEIGSKPPSVPVRVAPPPPVSSKVQQIKENFAANPIAKSQSYCSVSINLNLSKPTLERSISHEQKKTRTVIYESNPQKKPPNVTRKESLKEKDKNWNEVLNDRNHVNTLIDEMFAEVLNNRDNEDIEVSLDKTMIKVHDEVAHQDEVEVLLPQATTVLVIEDSSETETKDDSSSSKDSNSSTTDRKSLHVKFDDKLNHELLINELQNMKIEQERIMKRQRKPSKDLYDDQKLTDLNEQNLQDSKIHHSDWIELSNGQEVRLSSCQITIEEAAEKNDTDINLDPLISRLAAMSNLHGLPPLPKSLSSFSFMEGQQTPNRSRNTTPPGAGVQQQHMVYPPHPKQQQTTGNVVAGNQQQSSLDAQLAILRREMYSLRQLDLSLLSQLWSLNESIQDFRQMLQDHEDRVLSPPSPSPTPSSGDDADPDEFYTPSPLRFKPAPPPPALRRTSNSSSENSSV